MTLTQASKLLRGFIGRSQAQAIGDGLAGEEADFFENKLIEYGERIETMPKSYEQDGLGKNAIAYLHYFTPSANFYITEKDQETEQHQAFGLADLFGDGGELGYISLPEILKVKAELDLHWTPKPLAQI